jgi:DNA-binding NtrC family response regulator
MQRRWSHGPRRRETRARRARFVDNPRMSKDATVLVVDDDDALGMVLTGHLAQAGYEALHVQSGQAALDAVAQRAVDVVLTDLRMPGMDGLQLLRELGRRAPEVPVVMISAHGTVAVAVEAMKAGAKEFLTKPFDRDEVLFTVEKALAERSTAQPPPRPLAEGTSIVAASPSMRACLEDVRRAAQTVATVLLRGESGTGKEVSARAIHALSSRRDGPFVAVNLAAFPETLLESEIFGYEKGAFNGAAQRKPGRVDLAAGGTLFLDEIGDVPLSIQVKLLRLLQQKEYQRLGGTKTEKADCRFVAATHRDLEKMVKEGTFREDLFYRLSVIPIWLPALRDRPEDVRPLAEHFAAIAGRENGRPGLSLSPEALARLTAHAWPGNVRELENLVERLVVFTDGSTIGLADVERELRRGGPSSQSAPETPRTPTAASLPKQRVEAEKAAIVDALARAGGNRALGARLLGISRRTLYNKLSEYGIE